MASLCITVACFVCVLLLHLVDVVMFSGQGSSGSADATAVSVAVAKATATAIANAVATASNSKPHVNCASTSWY